MSYLDDNQKTKHKKRLIILGVILLVILVVGTSYALWQLVLVQTKSNVITTGCLNLTLQDNSEAINLTDAIPITDDDGRQLVPYVFTLTNVCATKTEYVINLETISEGIKILENNYVKVSLMKDSEEIFLDRLTSEHENSIKVIENANSAYMLDSGILGKKKSVTYSLRLWLDSDTPVIDEVMNAIFQGKITVTASYVPPKPENDNELYVKVKKQAVLDNVASEFVTGDTGIKFGEVSSDTNGKGVYIVADTKYEDYPVHYFRGEVVNNNVKFANLCWKIVRTTKTGGVKLIYNGLPNDTGGCTNTGESTQIGTSKFNENVDSDGYVGYMYPKTNENISVIKTMIDDWYQNNMIDYTKYLEDTVWCNDRSVYKTTNSVIYYGAYGRNRETHTPSIECQKESDKFTVSSEVGNGKLTYPVALLTTDEVVLAGYGYSGNSSSSYLYTGKSWWLLSPYYFGIYAFNFAVNSNGSLYNTIVSYSNGVRPSISLLPGIMVTSGDGTMNNPYQILTE